jgi:hypothetical protein
MIMRTVIPLFGVALLASGEERRVNYDESKVGDHPLPPLLQSADGSVISSKEHWLSTRRPEILQLFRDDVYGHTPAPPSIAVKVLESQSNALGGLATRTLIRISIPELPSWEGIEMMVYAPNGLQKPTPVFVGLSFQGNHAVTTERDVPLSTRWMRASKERGVENHRATEESRGKESSRWPLEMILKRGYAVATAYYGDIEPDHAEGWKTGLRAALSAEGADTKWKENDWGAIGAWAWGLSRMLDACAGLPGVDATRAAVIGHSRLGKTSLWAGAQDERFGIVISNNSGEGGAALTRRDYGETTKIITSAFPHWFCGKYASYADDAPALPVDQHMLVALAAPRVICIGSAEDDEWADPRGEFLAGYYAGEVYELFGLTGLPGPEMPALNTPVGAAVRYHYRTGKHDVTDYDWECYLEAADATWR